MRHPLPAAALLLAALLLATACGAPPAPPAPEQPEQPGEPPAPPAPPAPPPAIVVPPKGAAATLDVGSWNVEWFGATTNGPGDEALQLRNVAEVISDTDLDVWGLVEVVDEAQFRALVARLPDYAGVLAGGAAVQDGAAWYAPGEQTPALLYKRSVASVLGARVVLTASDFDFAGRPPLEVRLSVSLNGATEEVVVLVLHAKAFADVPSWQRREAASYALKEYLDTTWPLAKVLVVGDFNDDVDASITAGQPSPYRNFVEDAARYAFATKALSDAGVSSTLGYPDLIDHHLLSDELAATYLPGSAEVLRVDAHVPGYGSTTSDHLPVVTRYTFGTAPGGP
jgi:endonuclease/exonuclease/phosphatase family metal-dependent hydrolase